MNVTQQIATEIAALLSGNSTFQSYDSRWKFLLESYMGGMEYRQAGHLTRYQLETDQEYNARLQATPLENHCASVINVYNSFLFREDPVREFGTLSTMPELEDFLEDVDHDGRSIDQFMKDVHTWGSVFGHCWMMLVKPNIGSMTRADEIALGVRPYATLLTPLVVLDWEWDRRPSGAYELSYFRYIEDVNGDTTIVKEWTRQSIRTAYIDTADNKFKDDIVEENGLGLIPAVVAYNKRSSYRAIGVSDIADICDVQKFIYNATSEVDQSIRLNTHPSLVKTAETNAGIGAGSLIEVTTDLDPGLKPYLLEYSGGSISAIYESIQHAVDSIDKMANTGAVRATETREMSGVAMETEFELLNAKLSEKADNLELAEEQLWKLWSMYMGKVWNGKIEYPGSFNIKDTQSAINQLRIAKEAATDPRVLREIDNAILSWLNEGGPQLDGPAFNPEATQGE